LLHFSTSHTIRQGPAIRRIEKNAPMTASVTIVCGPAGSGKTTVLLERFHALAATGPGRALWITPSHRAAAALRPRLLGKTGGLCGAFVLTFDDFDDAVVRAGDPAGRTLSPVQRRLLLDDVILSLEERKELPHFDPVLETRGFTEGLVHLLAELMHGGVSSAEFARCAYRCGREDGPGSRSLNGKAIAGKQRQIARIYARYQRDLRRLGLRDTESRSAQAGWLWPQGRRGPFAALRAVFLDGFTDFTPAQHQLLRALAASVDELWFSLLDEAGDDRTELFDSARATRQRLAALSPDGGESSAATTRCTIRELQPSLDPQEKKNPSRPAGLEHLSRQLFQPLRRIAIGENPEGVSIVEAPGLLGEVRMIARKVKRWLLEGVPADSIVLASRDISSYADALHEVFTEYGVPTEIEGSEPLTRHPAIAFLLRAVVLPEDDWPFAGVTALLRNRWFRPDWEEATGRDDMPERAEALLRLLGEPRGRDAYLAAVKRWAEKQQPGLEDEQAEELRRQRTHELACECGPFLRRFFAVWDGAPTRAPLLDHVAWLRRWTRDLGLRSKADDGARAELSHFWTEVDAWLERDRRDGERPVDRRTFHRRLAALADEAGLPRTPGGPGRVLFLSADAARHLEVDHLVLMGMGERSFPRLTPPPGLLDEAEREQLRDAGVDWTAPADPLPREMLLFYQLVTRPRRSLVLSYPAVDERGQALLPSSFLLSVLDCFEPDRVPHERRDMPTQGLDEDEPLSPGEYRVRIVAASPGGRFASTALTPDLEANLRDAALLFQHRFREDRHTPHDGLFHSAPIIGEVTRLFGPEKIFSPTALEDYVACPFKFFLRHVLRLEPLEEPREEIEVTRRGQAFHRALARLHRHLKDEGIHEPTAEAEAGILEEVRRAVVEDVNRAPSVASKELWKLEGERLLRAAARYGEHWRRFLEPWRERGISPRPDLFEVDFGLPVVDAEPVFGPLILRTADIEVHVSGRIDRVDMETLESGEVVFWVIDYKTGRGQHYTGADLSQYRKLQLTLYALAVEEVLLAGHHARPLGLAYWLVTESGPKVVLPASRNQTLWLEESQRWRAVREQLVEWVTTLVGNIRRGVFPLAPRSEHCTQTCAFGQICRITQARSVKKEWTLPLPGVATDIDDRAEDD
jgi:ATP-dependent helicase/DNAse subunit B